MATSESDEITVHDLPEQCLSQRITQQSPLNPADAHGDTDHTLLEMLKAQHWNISAVARTLGVSRPTVYRQMQRQGIVPPNWQG